MLCRFWKLLAGDEYADLLLGVLTLLLQCGICGGRSELAKLLVGTITERELELDKELDVEYWLKLELENDEQYEELEDVDDVDEETELYEQPRAALVLWFGCMLLRTDLAE